jgi:hypothetical protein
MTRYATTTPQPLRRDLTDPRSSGPAPSRAGKASLNDRRSTR